jgi:hypothetical protein
MRMPLCDPRKLKTQGHYLDFFDGKPSISGLDLFQNSVGFGVLPRLTKSLLAPVIGDAPAVRGALSPVTPALTLPTQQRRSPSP